MENLSVFDYRSHCDYLIDWHQIKLRTHKNWNLSKFSKLIGLSHTSAITNIMKGRKVPSSKTVKAISDTLEHNQRERIYFEALVEQIRHKDRELVKTALDKVISSVKPKNTQTQISESKFKLIADPKYFLIRELVKLKDFELDLEWIKKRVLLNLSESNIQEIIKTLLEVGLLKQHHGKLIQSVDYYETSSEIYSEDIIEYHKKILDYSRKMINEIEVQNRHYTSDTIVLNKEDLPRLKKMISIFRKEASSSYDLDEGEEVYHLNIQLVPGTKS